MGKVGFLAFEAGNPGRRNLLSEVFHPPPIFFFCPQSRKKFGKKEKDEIENSKDRSGFGCGYFFLQKNECKK